VADPERVTPPQGGAPDPLAEQVIESRLAWRGTFFEVQSELVRCPDGHVGAREFIRHPGAVMVIALLPDGRILLERQWRHPLRQSFIEMPAGKLAPGEDPLACARRELLEETGYSAARWDRLGSFHNAIGYSDERIHIFLARDLELSVAATEPGEVIELLGATPQELAGWIARGEVTDVKTIIGAWWLERVLEGAAGV